MYAALKKELEDKKSPQSMVSRGLLIQEMPSKQIAASGSVNSDVDDLPYPEENDDSIGDESPDEIELRERHEAL